MEKKSIKDNCSEPAEELDNNIPEKKKLSVEEICRKHKLSVDDLITCGKKGLTATRIVRDRYGDVIAEDPDFGAQHKFFATFLELLGLLKEQSIHVTTVNLSARERELLDAYKRDFE